MNMRNLLPLGTVIYFDGGCVRVVPHKREAGYHDDADDQQRLDKVSANCVVGGMHDELPSVRVDDHAWHGPHARLWRYVGVAGTGHEVAHHSKQQEVQHVLCKTCFSMLCLGASLQQTKHAPCRISAVCRRCTLHRNRCCCCPPC